MHRALAAVAVFKFLIFLIVAISQLKDLTPCF
jgi:hypothetical protein